MSKTVAIIQARMTSTRLPGKVLKPLAGAPVLVRVLERIRRIDGIDEICIATPDGEEHQPIVNLCTPMDDIRVFRGSEHDVLKRFIVAIEETQADTVVRITSDCPFIDPEASAAIIAAFKASGADYGRTARDSGYPLGFDTEVVSTAALLAAHKETTDSFDREHVTPFIWQRPERFSSIFLDSYPNRRDWRLVLDTPEDYELTTQVYDALYEANPAFGYDALIALFNERPELLKINGNVPKKPKMKIGK